MNELKYPIPSKLLTSTIEAMRDYQLRLEVEAASLARLNVPEARTLAQQRLKDAAAAKELFEHYVHL